MRPRFQADEDFNTRIVDGLLRRERSIDIQRARTAGIRGVSDPEVLAVARAAGRILLSHDCKTMPVHFSNFVPNGSPGVIIVPQKLEIGEAIQQILLICTATDAEEWRNRIGYLPL